VKMAEKANWKVDDIVKFLLPPDTDSNNIAFILLKNYIISLTSKKNEDEITKPIYNGPKRRIDSFLSLDLCKIKREDIDKVLNINEEYTEEELCKILEYIISAGFSLRDFFQSLKIEKRFIITFNFLCRFGYSHESINYFVNLKW